MKFFVLGCNGMAGHMISIYLYRQGHDVLGFDRSKSKYVKSIKGDAKNTQILRDVITNGKFDAVINCIGILNELAEQNKGLAVFLNSYFPHFLADASKGSDTQIIHMSTDCVFSGKRGNYTEYDFRDGETFYDRSKALGELVDNKNITLRNSLVGPDINPNGIGLMNWFMQHTGEIKGFKNVLWTGQTSLQLAKTMVAAAKEKAHGLYNTVPDQSISKYDLLQLFNRYLKGGKMKIDPFEGVFVNKSLKRTRFDFDFPIPDYEKMIAELAEWIEAHKDLYPHYGL